MTVKSGVWEVCSRAHFEGRCRIFGPGEYESLGSAQDRISSARLAAAAGSETAAGDLGRPGAPAGEIALFDRRDYAGPLGTLTGAVPDFDRLGINDAVASLVVGRGTWELCTDANYRGRCRSFGPGRYPSVPDGEDDAYSSARPVQPPVAAGRRDDAGGAEVLLYDRREFDGPLRTLPPRNAGFRPARPERRRRIDHRPARNLAVLHRFLLSGRVPDLWPGPLSVASDRPGRSVLVRAPRGFQAGRNAHGAGTTKEWRASASSNSASSAAFHLARDFGSGPERIGFNDRADSVIVEGGTWILCSDANRTGECRAFGPGEYPALPPSFARGFLRLHPLGAI
ncbi:MAG: hypothetical protein IPH30_17135 [Betaproteobacteria bacterium]|nr:hypothetical protein [Betaproteobacteria bacterium]